MRTATALERLTEQQKDFLHRIAKEDIPKDHKRIFAKGYFNGLEDADRINADERRTLYNWFTVIAE